MSRPPLRTAGNRTSDRLGDHDGSIARAATPLGTLETTDTGSRIVVTAGVSAVLTTQSFVVRDVDLPAQGLLILGDVPPGLGRPDLVTAYGIIERFDYSRYVTTYDLGPASAYARYEGRKLLVADDVTGRGTE
jgi:hypothetical protein